MCGGPAWGPPWFPRPRGLPGGPCVRGAPAEGGGCAGPASRASLPGALAATGQLWPSGCPSGVGGCGPWRRETAQAPSSCSGGKTKGPASTPLSKPQPRTRTGNWWYLEDLGLGGRPAGAGLAPQAPQEVAHVEKVLVDAVVRAVRLQVHLEALARQDDGRGVLVGLQHVLCGESTDASAPGPPPPRTGPGTAGRGPGRVTTQDEQGPAPWSFGHTPSCTPPAPSGS